MYRTYSSGNASEGLRQSKSGREDQGLTTISAQPFNRFFRHCQCDEHQNWCSCLGNVEWARVANYSSVSG